MSWIRPVLNRWLRWVEKPYLARETDIPRMRRRFERKARVLLRGPRGACYDPFPMDDTPALMVTVEGEYEGRVILYFHGGAYAMGSPRTHRKMMATLCQWARTTAILLNYRKAPEHPFPAAVEDAVAAYEKLLREDTPPAQILLGGDSAGGGLALALLGEICRRDLPRPLGLFAFSPLTDLGFSGASLVENAGRDVLLPAERIQDLQEAYLGQTDAKDPRASPLFASFNGACPVWLCVGDSEILLDDTRRMAEHLRSEGVEVTEVIEHDLPHVWPLFHDILPEARATLRELAAWIRSLSRR